ncbi:acyl-CoA thioesterase [Christiangramia sp. OXR-203]|jgi:acyl-CoA thioester hydrolase|uniref:acyl-CoA thioesterase n=1 Tax=Christiangramia sp. OXR-203 TaxID=3100176 RepID=UPI002AC8ED87|nr:acyl-CoA thioesterase [Christiangramia sp. OXR-203]WPY99508.1 acyl-CoA thioesterase [Christiangramia sp. OXR-203]
MSVNSEIYQKYITVSEDDLDDQQHVNNVRYVQWIQDVAQEHWESRASEEQKAGLAWVVVRHEIDYKMEALLNDEILLETRIIDTTHVTSIREVVIKNNDSGKLLAKAKTTWCLLDQRTKKPQRISDELKQIFQ